MQGLQTRRLFIAKSTTICVFLWLACLNSTAQDLVSLPSATCASCSGEATYTHPQQATILWFDAAGALLQAEDNTTSTLTGLCPGLYRVEATDGSQVFDAWFTINSNQASAGSSETVFACAGTADVDLFDLLNNASAQGYWTDPLGTPIAGVQPSQQNSSGAYLHHLDVGGCEATARLDLQVQENADPGLTTTYLICESYAPFFLTDFLSGDPDYGGEWFGPTGEVMDGFYDPAIMNSSLFTYRIDSVEGCPPVFSSIFVMENPEPDAGLPSEVLVCENGFPFALNTQIEGTPALDGTWQDSQGNAIDNWFDPTQQAPGIYTYTVLGQTPCPNATTEVQVMYTPGLDPGAPADLELCRNAQVQDLFGVLGGNPMAGGNWTNPMGVPSNGQLDPSVDAGGTYTYQLSGIGCQPVSATVDVTLEEAPFAGPNGQDFFCETAGQVDLFDLLPAGTDTDGNWSGEGLIGSSFVWEAPGTTAFEYTVGDGICPFDASNWMVHVAPQPEAGPDQALFYCSPPGTLDLATFTEPSPGFSVSWNETNGAFTTAVQDLPPGFHSFTLTAFDNGSCPPDQAIVTVQVEAPVVLPDPLFVPVCDTQFPLNLNELAAFDPSWDVAWTLDDGATSDLLLLNSPDEAAAFSYSVANHESCPPSLGSVSLEVVPLFDPEDPVTIEVCHTAAPIDLNALVGASDELGQWTFGDQPVDAWMDPANQNSGSYVLQVPASGPCPATTAEVQATVDPGFTYSAGPDQSLCGTEQMITVGSAGEPNCTYSWSPAAWLDDPGLSNPAVVFPQDASDGVLAFTVEATNGICSMVDAVNVTVFPEPNWTLPEAVSGCVGDQVNLTVLGDLSAITWSANGTTLGTGTDLAYTFGTATQLEVAVANDAGCTDSGVVNVTSFPLPNLEIQIEAPAGCSPLLVSPSVTNAADAFLSWYVDTELVATGTSPSWTMVDPGNHSLSVEALSVDGCSVLLTEADGITVHESPTASFDLNTDVLSFANPELTAIAVTEVGATHTWFLSGDSVGTGVMWETQLHEPITSSHLSICMVMESAFGCRDTTCRSIVIDGSHTVFVPSAFTPDNDGINETFGPITTGIDPNAFRFSVFNRWGEILFESNDPHARWRGNHRGGNYFVPDGVYAWLLEVRDGFTAEVFRYSGHVTVIR